MSDTDMVMGDAGKAMPVPRGRYSDTETYDYLDFVYSGDASYVAKKLTIGNPPAEDNEYWQLLARGGTLTENSDVSGTTVTFEEAETRVNIFSKDSLRTIAGKVKRWLSDLKPIAFSGKYTDLDGRVTITNNDLANVPGTAWDAVRGALLRKDLDKLNSELQAKQTITYGSGIMLHNNPDKIYTMPNNGIVYLNSWGTIDIRLNLCDASGVRVGDFTCKAGNNRTFWLPKGTKLYVEYESTNSIQVVAFLFDSYR